jgi:hypothetical protein
MLMAKYRRMPGLPYSVHLIPGTEMLMGSLKMSALHLAAKEGNLECASLLLAAGADPRSR